MKLLASLFLASLGRRRFATALSLLAVTLGVALGVAVSVVNRSALDEFSHGVRVIAGEADLQIIGPRTGFDEALFARVALAAGLDVASPVLEVDARLAGRDETLRIVGLDLLRSVRIQPALRPELANGVAQRDLFDPDLIFLSPAAMQALGLKPGDPLPLQIGLAPVRLRVGGLAGGFEAGQRAALMDIAAAQWRLNQLGRLSRIDLRWAAGGDTPQAREALRQQLPPGVHLLAPAHREAQAEALSLAYRANLTMLAVIALATGAFLVFATQTLSVVRRESEFALMRALGVTQRQLLGGVLGEGALIGLLGGVAGVALGYLLASLALKLLGGDLGAGYFAGSRPRLHLDWVASAAFLLLGFAASVLGSLWPALHAARAAIAPALRSGHNPAPPPIAVHHLGVIALLLAGAGLAYLPPVFGLPAGGYLAVACLLAAGVLSLPAVAHALMRVFEPLPGLVFGLARARVAGASANAVIAAGGVLASVALAVSMAIMVASFRDSVDAWLARVLPADLYVRSAGGGALGGLGPEAVTRIAALPGVARIDTIRHEQLRLRTDGLPVALIARPIPAAGAGAVFPMREQSAVAGDAIWISEAMVDLYGWRPGAVVELPLGGALHRFVVGGVWRDYARQSGAILIDLARYRALTGDKLVNDVALWLRPGTPDTALRTALRAAFGEQIEIGSAGEIRAISLALFDRTFAVTYALEACAVLIGLFGIAASFAALAAARRREFGMLRHLGVTRRQIGAMLAWEGALVAAIGVLSGLVTGAAISVVLIHVVNRQSFHWSMDYSVPAGSLAVFALAMIAAASVAAVLAGAQAMRQNAVSAVREDA